MPRCVFPLIFILSQCHHLPTGTESETEPAEPVLASHGMVSSAHPRATEAGLAVLAAGGNAFDAAVTVAAALNVVEPMMSGIGGYGTILVYDVKRGEAWFLNASGRIPAGLDSDVFRAPTPNFKANRRGPKAVSTPGNANAWQAMHRKYGVHPWRNLFHEPIRLAEDGFVIGSLTAHFIADAFDSFPANAQAFYGQEGKPLAAGQRLIQKDLAHSLRLIAEHGAEALHGGALGKTVAKAMAEAGSFLTLEDLTENRAEWWKPIRINYRGHDVLTASPPATAFPSLIRLGLMSRYEIAGFGHNSTDYLHRFAEVSKHAFWCRLRYAGDPEIQSPPLEMLLSEAYWQKQVAAIDTDRAKPFQPPGRVTVPGKNTTHFVVADRWGNVVSATQTLGNLFGSRIMPAGTGIWLNNSLAYCTFEPKGNPMDAHAGHHKLSGDCPTLIMRDDKPWVALGTPGGHTIGQTVPQMVMNLVDFEMDIQRAIDAPRISFIEPDKLAVEDRIPEQTRAALAKLGHHVLVVKRLGNATGLSIAYGPDGKPIRFEGASDRRGIGSAKGLSN